MDNKKIDIREGTINFWIKKNQLQFNDNKITPFVQVNTPDGSIFIIKDSDNKLKFFHVYLGKGRTDVEYDVFNLDPNERHMITVTWSVKNKEIALFIDAQEVARTKIDYK